MRKTLRQIITCMLVACIMLTGNTITAEAKVITYQKDRTGMENIVDLNGTTVTMKVGDTKKVDLIEESDDYSIDSTKRYAWASSDETIVSMQRAWDISTAETYEVSHVIIKAEKPGTATITATPVTTKGETVSFTVKVKAPKVTAKQKKCKHKWKTTKKATCLESGMKTCKKCKIQKVITKREHMFVTESKEKNDYKYYIVYLCDICGEEFSPLKYGSDEAAREAYGGHLAKYGHDISDGWKYYEVPYDKETSYKDIQVCETCGYSKMELQLIFDVNDPSKNIYEEDLWNQ